ncbi:hypothetical protein [Flavisphingomonas formosensis]|uniref:hypothetical protein n=1 Tax=Flavisphingomonas formosensis TaxID=861534 RepID=UPI0012F81A1B|nr:hypothetical protein [Sphingomonas formosensis]
MSHRVRPWLPASALSVERVRAALAAPLDAWTQRWFAQAAITLSACQPAARLAAVPESTVRIAHATSTSAILLPARGKRHLIEAVLDISLSDVTVSEDDHRLLDAFARRICEDLLDRLGASGEAPAPGATSLRLTISHGRDELLHLDCADTLIIAHIRRARRPAAQPPKLTGRWQALGGQPVAAVALAGRAQLSLEELKGLAVGDVVLLEGAVNGRAALSFPPSGAIMAQATLGNDQGRRILSF